MQCPTCRVELPPGAKVCPACGTPVPYASSSPYSTNQNPYGEPLSYVDKQAQPQQPSSPNIAQQPVPQNPHVYPQAPQQQQFPPQNSGYPGWNQQPQHPSYPDNQSGYPGWNQQPTYPNNQPGYQNLNQQPVYPVNHPGYQPAPQAPYPGGMHQGGPYQPMSPPPQKSHLGRNITIGVAILLVVVILVVLANAAFNQHQPTTSITPTPVTNASPTQAPGTTPSTITTTDPQTLYTQITSQTPAVNDPLNVAGSTTNWQSLNQSTQGSCTFTGGALHAKGPNGSSVGCLDTSGTYTNFAVQIQMTMVQGYETGLIFRADTLGAKLYAFAISSQGVYILVKAQNGSTNNAKLLTGGNSSVINTGLNQSNQMTVIARNTNLYLYINGTYLATASDATSSAGLIGTIALSGPNNSPVDVAYSNLKIWNL